MFVFYVLCLLIRFPLTSPTVFHPIREILPHHIWYAKDYAPGLSDVSHYERGNACRCSVLSYAGKTTGPFYFFWQTQMPFMIHARSQHQLGNPQSGLVWAPQCHFLIHVAGRIAQGHFLQRSRSQPLQHVQCKRWLDVGRQREQNPWEIFTNLDIGNHGVFLNKGELRNQPLCGWGLGGSGILFGLLLPSWTHFIPMVEIYWYSW